MLSTLFVSIFVAVALFLGLFVLIQQGKGDMGLGGLGGGSQTLFGGSGGQSFFEKATWLLGGLFILGSLGLTVLKMRDVNSSRIGSSSSHTLPQLPEKSGDAIPLNN